MANLEPTTNHTLQNTLYTITCCCIKHSIYNYMLLYKIAVTHSKQKGGGGRGRLKQDCTHYAQDHAIPDLLRGPIEDGATVDEFPFIFRHRLRSRFWGEDSVVAVPL